MQGRVMGEVKSINCVFSRIYTYKKVFNKVNKIVHLHRGDKELIKHEDPLVKYKIAGSTNSLNDTIYSPEEEIGSLQFNKPSDYLTQIKKYVSDDIISNDNYETIHQLSHYFDSNITSFFGFETNLLDDKARSDYLIAISSENGEKEELMQLLRNKRFNENIKGINAWKNIKQFVDQWTTEGSILHKNVKGLWFEFDTSISYEEFPIPNIFFQTKKIRIENTNDEQHFQWITQKALPILTGKTMPEQIEKKLIDSIKKLPSETSVVHFGTMISRDVNGLRIVINRIKPTDIIPYLQSIGWNHDTQRLAGLLDEIQKYASRIILHLNITEQVDEKIGLECSFSYDKYHTEQQWEQFLSYLEEKHLCVPEKKEALLNFIGAEYDHKIDEFDPDEFMPSVMIHENAKSTALVRYLSHVKFVYTPNKPVIAKAYPGIRLLGSIT